jgi:hypothetical protein
MNSSARSIIFAPQQLRDIQSQISTGVLSTAGRLRALLQQYMYSSFRNQLLVIAQ